MKTKKPIQRANLKKSVFFGIMIGLLLGAGIFFFTKNLINSLISFISVIALSIAYSYIKFQLDKSKKISKMEQVFPEFLQLMASNLRAGITIDKSMILASREEFQPLTSEIMQTGRDITTGKEIELALEDMSERIGSEKIKKTIQLIISGIKAGGDLSILLGETSTNMRERGFIEKKAASNVLMYVIFIFIAVAVGAPALFALSSVLVEILTNLMSNMTSVENVPFNVPFTLTNISVSITFIKYFSLVFIIAIDILASMIIGLVSKGKEKEGTKYILPLIAISCSVFFLVRILLSRFLSGFF